MSKMIFTFLFFVYSFGLNSQINIEAVEDDSLLYSNHNSLETFLDFLKHSTEKFNTDIEKLCFIRKRVAEIIDIGFGGKDISLIAKEWTNLNARNYYDLFYKNLATVKCGGTSYFLRNIYRNMGYESYVYDMGCNDQYTHQVTIVKNKDDGKFYVQDAFHNISFIDKKSKNYIYFERMITLLSNKKHRKIKIKFDEFKYVTTIDTTGVSQMLVDKEMSKSLKNFFVKRISKMNRQKLIKASRNYNKKLKICLKENQLPTKHIYLYLIPSKYNSKRIFELILRFKRNEEYKE